MPELYGPSGQEYRLFGENVTLEVRQQPEHALVTQTGKEKGRKPVDPPPIVQMNVKAHIDPNRNWLCSPHVFMCASPLEGAEGDSQVPKEKVVGQQVSSLHRLKDINDEDGGFFVFGDISLRGTGTHRLKFDLYNLESGSAVFLVSIISKPFEVVSNKDFKGLSESSHLSRTFSDQGVRLRLRKEPRSLGAGVKRSWQSPEETPATQRQGAAYGGASANYAYSNTGSIKRVRPSSNHSSAGHYPHFQPSTSRPSYGSSTMGVSAGWADQSQHGYMGTQTSGGASYLPVQSYSVGNASAQWQRGLQAAPVTTQAMGSSLSPYSNTRRESGLLAAPYFPQQNSQYLGSNRTSAQPSGNSFPDLGEFQSPNNIPEGPQSESYLQSGNEYGSQLHSTTPVAFGAEQQTYQQHGVHTTPISKWAADTARSASTNPSAGLYSSGQGPDSGVSGLQYETISHTPTTQYSQTQQSVAQAPYAGVPRAAQQYPHTSSSMPNTSLSSITGNFFATASDADWPELSPHEPTGPPPLTGHTLAQHQQTFSTPQSWGR